MKGATVTLTEREQQRGMVLNQVERDGLTGQQAARLMGLSVRQVQRLRAAYRKDGVAALAHGNRGRSPVHRITDETRRQVVELAHGTYRGFNHHHLQEELAEQEGVKLSRSSLWRILTRAGVPSIRKRRRPLHRHQRQRYPQEGMLLQIDGSHHLWLEGRGPSLSLVAFIDDATGTIPAALFREQEDAHGYFLVLRETITTKGLPLALYSDQHSIFQVNPKKQETLEEQLAGERQPTQFGRALRELGIQSIVAHSPQAKGRVERLFGTLQDRLVGQLRLRGASTLEEANQVLGDYLPKFNRAFAVPPAQEGTAYREASAGQLDQTLCFKYPRTVASDNTVRWYATTLQLLPDAHRTSYARAKVEVQERLDGSLAVVYQGSVISTREAPPQASALRARKAPRADIPKEEGTTGTPAVLSSPYHPSLPQPPSKHTSHPKPGPNHPWRKIPSATKSLNH